MSLLFCAGPCPFASHHSLRSAPGSHCWSDAREAGISAGLSDAQHQRAGGFCVWRRRRRHGLLVGQRLGERFGQTVVVENWQALGGNISAKMGSRAQHPTATRFSP